jgi:hypothetical protein
MRQYCTKWEFGQSYCKDLLNMILMKFIVYFFSVILFSMNFRILYEFL